MFPATTERPPLRIAFGRDPAAFLDAGVTVLGGDEVDDLFAAAQPSGRSSSLALFRMEDWLLGAGTVPAASGLEQATQRLFQNLFKTTRGFHVARIWSYVPAINEPGPSGLENYRAFCRGRSLAFEQRHGPEFKLRVPAASAVGCASPRLTVAFAACQAEPRHVENPLQMPACDYPREYGPRSPSFTRATIVPGDREAAVFVSGTAAIRGHATVAPDELAGQLECTLENLHEISRACGLGPRLDQGGQSSRRFKVYLRRAADQPLVAATLGERFFGPGDRVSYLRADICRKPLLVEIEATLFGVPNSAFAR